MAVNVVLLTLVCLLVNGCNGFVNVSTILTTSGYVLHMEFSTENPDHLFYSEKTSIRLYNLVTGDDTIIAGHATETGYVEGIGAQARFNQVAGFTQKNSTHLIVTDQKNKCIRLVNHITGETSTYAGQCGSIGTTTGRLTDTRFIAPWSIRSCGDNYYVVDHGSNIIRLNDSAQMSDIYLSLSSTMPFPRDILFRHDCYYAYVTYNHGVGYHSNEHSQTQINQLTSTTPGYGYQDGMISSSRFHNPIEILQIGYSAKAVIDNGNNRLRLIHGDMYTTSVCSGLVGSVDGGMNDCKLFMPWSLAVNGDKTVLLIGEYKAIRKMKIGQEFNNKLYEEGHRVIGDGVVG